MSLHDHELEKATMDATSALLALRMGLRDGDVDLVRDAAFNLSRAAELAHRCAFRLSRTHSKEN